MIEYEELRAEIDRYLMERFKYCKSLVCLTVDNVIDTRRNSRVDLYLRIRRVESLFPPDCLIIARLSFTKERIGHGTHLLRFLTEVAQKYGFNYIGIEDITRSLEQKYGLHTAEKLPKEKKPELKMVDVSLGNAKEQVENVVREVINKYHFLTFTEYKAVLTKFNIATEEVKGSHYGSSYSGIVYSATDNDDSKVGNPFSSATLGKFAGSEALEKKYQASKEHLEKSRPAAPLKRAINQAFVGATDKEQLRYNLFQSGIGVVYRENATGRLYGITFIDHNTGVVLNGSRLGKEYAANAIVDRLENPKQYEHLINTAQSQGSTTFALQQSPPVQQTIHHTEQHLEVSNIGDSIGSLFDMPILPNGDDPEEEMFRRRMQRKKKKGRRM